MPRTRTLLPRLLGRRGGPLGRNSAAGIVTLLLIFVALWAAPRVGDWWSGPATLPPQYLGLDSYLHWDKLPYLEIGDRVEGRSTADPAGSNNDGMTDLGSLPGGRRLLFDQAGPGVVTFLRMQESYDAPWRLTVDHGTPAAITEADLGQPDPTSAPATTFPYPLSLNTAQSQGSSVIATALPYASELRFSSAAKVSNFYALYRRLPLGAPLPAEDTTDQAAALLRSAGTDIAPTDIPHEQGVATLDPAGGPVPVTTIQGKQELRALKFRVPLADAARFGDARLRIYWDGEATPSVDAPMKFLAGDGAGVYQPAGRQLVAGLPANITGDGATYLEFSLYWPMPFSSGARIELVPGAGAGPAVPVSWSARYQPFTDPSSWVGEFHANYTEVPAPKPGVDMNFLDFHGSGKLVGTVLNFGQVGGTLEGDPHIYLDDSRTPQIAVTGTEEWGMGGNYWNNGVQTTLPMAGLPSATTNPPGSEVDGSALYRFMIADSIPFNSHIVVNWEHGGVDESTQPYRATMLWYGTPTRTATATDDLVPSQADSAAAHGYRSPGDQLYDSTSGYEYTVRTPEVTGVVASTSAPAAFTMTLRQDNVGAFLRRTLDSCVADQRANVFVDGTFAGTWFTAGGSPRAGGRCWRDDDLPLPRALTQGKQRVSIRIEPVAGGVQATTAWTSSDYRMFSFVAPSVP